MRGVLLAALLMWPVLLRAQGAIPVFLGQSATMLAPTVDGSGRTVVFGSTITDCIGIKGILGTPNIYYDPCAFTLPSANPGTMDLFVVSADGSGLRRLTYLANTSLPQPQGANAVSFSANAARAVYTVVGPTTPTLPVPVTGSAGEEVHVVEVSSGADRIVAVDTGGCIQPLEAAICLGCSFTCVNAPHITDDGAKVLYSVSRGQPFYAVNSDGTGLTHLPVYSGALAPAPRRVISTNGLVVFTSSLTSPPPATGGPVVTSVEDVYVMKLDGTNVQNVTKFGNNTPLPAPFSAFNALYLSNATISADGGTIVFEGTPQTITGTGGTVTITAIQAAQIWLVHTDGSGLRALTTASDSSTGPSVSGDGSLVTFVRNGQVFIVRSDGTGLKALTNFQMSAARNPVISADGSLVVFAIGHPDGGLGAVYADNSDGSNLHAVYAPRALNHDGVTGIVPGTSLAPGSLFTAYGMNLGPDTITAAPRYPLPESLAGVSLLVNGRPAPLLAVTPWQANAQLPADLTEGPAAFQFRFADGASSAAAAADVKSAAPAIFIISPPSATSCFNGVCVSQSPQAAAFHTNTGVPADPTHPAVAGEVLEFYGTGLGVTNPLVAAGIAAPGPPPARTVTTPQVLIGNISAQVTFAGLTSGFAGVYQVNAVVPANLRPGQQTVQWQVGTTSSNVGTIWVK